MSLEATARMLAQRSFSFHHLFIAIFALSDLIIASGMQGFAREDQAVCTARSRNMTSVMFDTFSANPGMRAFGSPRHSLVDLLYALVVGILTGAALTHVISSKAVQHNQRQDPLTKTHKATSNISHLEKRSQGKQVEIVEVTDEDFLIERPVGQTSEQLQIQKDRSVPPRQPLESQNDEYMQLGDLSILRSLDYDDTKRPISHSNLQMSTHFHCSGTSCRVSGRATDQPDAETDLQSLCVDLRRALCRLAAREGRLDLMKRFYDAIADEEQRSIMELAVKYNRYDIVDFLILTPLTVEKPSYRAMELAAYYGRTKMMRRIIQLQGLLVARGDATTHPLAAAAARGNLDAVKLLVKMKADCGERKRTTMMESLRQTPVIAAAAEGQFELLQYLATTCASFQDKDPKYDSLRVATKLRRPEMIIHLFRCGASFSSDKQGLNKALSIAVDEGHMELATLALEHGADANARDDYWCTLFQWSCSQGNVKMVELFLHHGASVNKLTGYRTAFGSSSPLEAATMGRHQEVVEILLQHGADPQESFDSVWWNVQRDLEIFVGYGHVNALVRKLEELKKEHKGSIAGLCGLDGLLHRAMIYQVRVLETGVFKTQSADYRRVIRALMRYGAKLDASGAFYWQWTRGGIPKILLDDLRPRRDLPDSEGLESDWSE